MIAWAAEQWGRRVSCSRTEVLPASGRFNWKPSGFEAYNEGATRFNRVRTRPAWSGILAESDATLAKSCMASRMRARLMDEITSRSALSHLRDDHRRCGTAIGGEPGLAIVSGNGRPREWSLTRARKFGIGLRTSICPRAREHVLRARKPPKWSVPLPATLRRAARAGELIL